MPYYKYPRTYHLPWSPGISRDDKVLKDIWHFLGREVVITTKMDGENTTMYRGYIHARSIDSKDHPSRHWVKNLYKDIHYLIPEGWRVCGENLYAKHSIHYKNLSSYFLAFSVWTNENICLSWPHTVDVCQSLFLNMVPVLYSGTILTENHLKDIIWEISESLTEHDEGFVVRLADSFSYEDFRYSVAKYVKKDHVQTDDHWMHQRLVLNKLREETNHGNI